MSRKDKEGSMLMAANSLDSTGFKGAIQGLNSDVSTFNQNDSRQGSTKTNLISDDLSATSPLFKLLHDFYVLRNFQEPAQSS